MRKEISPPKKRRGRPPLHSDVGSFTLVLDAPLRRRIEVWAKAQPDLISRGEAMRRLLERALSK